MWNENWIKGVDYPEWGDTEVYRKTIIGGYLLQGESPKDAYDRVAKTVARRLYKPELAEVFFDYIWKGWLNLASPVLSNTGTDRGLPISCFGIDVADSIQDIGAKNLEMMMLAKHGGGVGVGINMIRPAGAKITGNPRATLTITLESTPTLYVKTGLLSPCSTAANPMRNW